MQLDAKRCPVGTVGCVPPLDLEGFADFPHPSLAGAVQPSVILGEDRVWRWSVADANGDDRLPEGMPVFSDWQSAVRWKIEFDRRAARVLCQQASRLLHRAMNVSLLLDVLAVRERQFAAGAFPYVMQAPGSSASAETEGT